MVIWPALQARAFALVNIFNCGMDVRSFVRSFVRSSSFVIPKNLIIFNCGMDIRSFVVVVVVVVVVVRPTQKILPIVHAAAGARACPSNGMWRICDFDFWHEKSI